MKQASQKWFVIWAVLFGTFTVILNTSLLNPSIPFFADWFHIDELGASWIINIYVLMMGLTLPLTGFLSGRYGAKLVYIAGLLLFLAGSAAAAEAWNLPLLIASRGIQGVGAGLLTPLSITLIFSAVPVEERGMATGLWGVVSMLAPTIGPTLGGLIIDHMEPRMLFWVNLPTGLLGLITGLWFIAPSKADRTGRLDLQGYAYAAAGIGLSFYALGAMNTMEQAASLMNWLLLCAGLFSLGLFILRGRTKPNSLFDLSLLSIRPFRMGTAVTTLIAAGYYVSFFLIPIILQDVYHYGATVTGFIFIPDALMTGAAMMAGGKILDRSGARHVVAWGLGITGITTLLLGFLTPTTPLWYITLLMAIRGAGFGLSGIPATTAGMGALPEHRLVEGSVMNDLIEQITASFAIIVSLLVFVIWRDSAVSGHMLLEEANLRVADGLFIALAVLTFAVLLLWWFSYGTG